MFKFKLNSKTHIAITAGLALVFFLTSAFAIMTAVSSKTNTFTVGDVSIDLLENFDANFDGITEFYDTSHKTIELTQKIVARQRVKKEPYIKNSGNCNTWTYLAVGIPVDTLDRIYADNNGDVALSDEQLHIKIKAFAIQENFASENSSEATWAKYTEKWNKEKIFGTEVDSWDERVELFDLIGLNTDDWIPMYDEYYEEETYNYYFFALDRLLTPGEESAPIFTAIKLIDILGEKFPPNLMYTIRYDNIKGLYACVEGSYFDITGPLAIPDKITLLDGKIIDGLDFYKLFPDGCEYDIDVILAGEDYLEENSLKAGRVNIPVRQIAIAAFWGSSMTSVVIPDTITDIDMSTFEECIYMESALIPDTVSIVHTNAFANCTNLKELTVPLNMTPFNGFTNVSNIETINVTQGVGTANYGFTTAPWHYSRDKITTINIDENVTVLPARCFSGCSAVTNVVLPDNLEAIERYAFDNCSSLASITYREVVYTSKAYLTTALSNNGVLIGSNAFDGIAMDV